MKLRTQIHALLALVLLAWLPQAVAQGQLGTRPVRKAVAFGEHWGKEGEKALVDFSAWAKSSGASSTQEISTGIDLAKQRRRALVRLIQSDPARAIASAVPAGVRKHLPAEVAAHLETHVSGVGDLSVRGGMRAPGGPPVEAVQRFVTLNGQTYRAYVYGRRGWQTTKHGIPLQGIVIDGVLALHENALREIADGELPVPNQPFVDLRAPAEKANAVTAPVLAEMGGKLYGFASPEQLAQAELRIQVAEAPIGPKTAQTAGDLLQAGASLQAQATPAAPSAWTTGNKKVLIIRVDFSDMPGDPKGWDNASPSSNNATIYTASYLQNMADTVMAPYIFQSSYGQTSLTNTVTSQLYRMPRKATYYATNANGNDTIVTDAENAAAANYTIANYDRVVILFTWLGDIPGSLITYGGWSDIGGPVARCNGYFNFFFGSHELGHTYGLFHAGLWQVNDGNPVSPRGAIVEYGDDFDSMGNGDANDPRTDYNPYFKNLLGWIPDTQVQTITQSGTYRVYRFDNSTGSGTLALKLPKDSNSNYWIGIRRKFTTNASMQNGAYVLLGYNSVFNSSNGGSQSGLLDMTTPGTSDQDAALAVGATFTDNVALGHIGIVPLSNGGSAPSEYMDIQVTIVPPVWVDFGFTGSPKSGTFANPYNILADGVSAVSSITGGGVINLKGPQSSATPIQIPGTTPMRLQSVGGTVTIGH